jgi:hypothetical protein
MHASQIYARLESESGEKGATVKAQLRDNFIPKSICAQVYNVALYTIYLYSSEFSTFTFKLCKCLSRYYDFDEIFKHWSLSVHNNGRQLPFMQTTTDQDRYKSSSRFSYFTVLCLFRLQSFALFFIGISTERFEV